MTPPSFEPADIASSDVGHLFRFTGEFSETIIASAGGAVVRDRDGREILDFTSGQMSAILGHSHPEIVATVDEAVARLDHLHSSFLSDVVLEFTSALSALLPASLSKVLPLSTGAESNEAAIRMAKPATGRFEVVAFDRSWHGMTGGASAAAINGARRGYGAPVPGVLALPTPHAYRSPFASNGTYDWRAELDFGFDLIDRQSIGSLAAMIAEPVPSSVGIIELPDGYLAALAEHCRRRGILPILDEAQTVLGRTGDRFAFEHGGVMPDILTLSKTLGAGLPLSATVASPDVEPALSGRLSPAVSSLRRPRAVYRRGVRARLQPDADPGPGGRERRVRYPGQQPDPGAVSRKGRGIAPRSSAPGRRKMRIERVGETIDLLGEGPLRDVAEQALYRVDSRGCRIRRLDWATGERRDWDGTCRR